MLVMLRAMDAQTVGLRCTPLCHFLSLSPQPVEAWPGMEASFHFLIHFASKLRLIPFELCGPFEHETPRCRPGTSGGGLRFPGRSSRDTARVSNESRTARLVRRSGPPSRCYRKWTAWERDTPRRELPSIYVTVAVLRLRSRWTAADATRHPDQSNAGSVSRDPAPYVPCVTGHAHGTAFGGASMAPSVPCGPA